MKTDQEYMKVNQWDCNNKDLLTNKVKESIENIGLAKLEDRKERYWILSILWMWYHHAISSTLWQHGNKEDALTFSEIALELQPEDHPNKITKLLNFLLKDDLTSAKEWSKEIEGAESDTTKQLIKLYEQSEFFPK